MKKQTRRLLSAVQGTRSKNRQEEKKGCKYHLKSINDEMKRETETFHRWLLTPVKVIATAAFSMGRKSKQLSSHFLIKHCIDYCIG
jgi:hypothetical protein